MIVMILSMAFRYYVAGFEGVGIVHFICYCYSMLRFYVSNMKFLSSNL